MPPISVLHSSYLGNPTIEILRNGQPWGEDHFGPVHFSFGITKARMIRAALPILEQFVTTQGGQPWSGRTQTATDLTCSGVVSAEVEKFDDFENAAGNQIGQPYLRLTSGETSIGLGVSKCQALVFVAEELERFLAQSGQPRLRLN
jgi:hypothetical protein